ncbi:hypothetical protein TMatcc_005880 [Talaromyces marneffei ATCC 18224]|uniref:uncharacterized protein n=1 Tax=Talaromyces marneffei TaxID=37727 RepID=UPI0012AAAD90|nr:uncharacterized protein EYB26_005616 [Talaromyces marneffei]KAE8554568.1 hypothetical protein EYB25_003108 [Talaromyces marneffei]QGA17939.1 hypothetical protein EYB26_005616 [Talaromyces marneffei]
MAQTPRQKKANEKFAKHEAAKRGKPQTVVKRTTKQKSPVSIGWIVLLAFVVCGGLIFELLRVVPEIWTAITSFFRR